MIVYNPYQSLSTSLVTSEAGSLMSHYGEVGSYDLAPPLPPLATTAGRRAYGFAELCTHTDNSIKNNAAQGCPASYTSATGRTFKFKNLRPEIASRLEIELQSLHAKNLTLLQDLAYLDEDAPPTPTLEDASRRAAAAWRYFRRRQRGKDDTGGRRFDPSTTGTGKSRSRQ